jgi:Ca2+ transporting ATPase
MYTCIRLTLTCCWLLRPARVDESHLTGESDDVVKDPPSAVAAGQQQQQQPGEAAGASSAPLAGCLLMSGSKVLEGFGRLLVLAVGPNSQQGMIQSMVLHCSSAAGPGQQPDSGSSSSSSAAAAAVPMLREATPLTSRLEDVANSIGGVGLAAAVGVLAVNSGLYTAELLAAGGSLWSSASLEVRPVGRGLRLLDDCRL